MSIPRVYLLLLLVFVLSALGVAPLAAQTSPDLSLAVSPQAKLLDNPFGEAPVDPFNLQMNTPPETKPTSPFLVFSDSKTHVVHDSSRTVDLVDGQGDIMCLSMRTYRVKRDNPQSDAVRPAGYTTCTPTKRFQVKTAVDSGTVSH